MRRFGFWRTWESGGSGERDLRNDFDPIPEKHPIGCTTLSPVRRRRLAKGRRICSWRPEGVQRSVATRHTLPASRPDPGGYRFCAWPIASVCKEMRTHSNSKKIPGCPSAHFGHLTSEACAEEPDELADAGKRRTKSRPTVDHLANAGRSALGEIEVQLGVVAGARGVRSLALHTERTSHSRHRR